MGKSRRGSGKLDKNWRESQCSVLEKYKHNVLTFWTIVRLKQYECLKIRGVVLITNFRACLDPLVPNARVIGSTSALGFLCRLEFRFAPYTGSCVV